MGKKRGGFQLDHSNHLDRFIGNLFHFHREHFFLTTFALSASKPKKEFKTSFFAVHNLFPGSSSMCNEKSRRERASSMKV